MSVIAHQLNDDGTESIVRDNNDGTCTIYVGNPPIIFLTKTVKKEKLIITLKQIKEGKTLK